MLFPGSRIWYEGSAADLASLTDEIKVTAFSGHIVLEFQDSLDVVICAGGEFLRVIEKIGRRILSTKKYREIWGKCQIKPGRMTVFALPPGLAARLRSLQGRRLVASGTAAGGCDPARILADLRARGFAGVLDCVTPAGKLLLEFEAGAITACHYVEYEGLNHGGLPAFTLWHQGFVRSTLPCFFFVSEPGGDAEGHVGDEILMDYADQIRLPLASSLERLNRAFGRTALAGAEFTVGAGAAVAAVYLVDGELELGAAGGGPGGVSLRPGEFFGLGAAHARDAAPVRARALVDSRYLCCDDSFFAAAFENSPTLAVRLVRATARQLEIARARLEAFRAEPRLRDVESAVLGTLLAHPGGDGVSSAALFRELTQQLPLSLPEIDALFRKLVLLEVVRLAGGRVTLAPREF